MEMENRILIVEAEAPLKRSLEKYLTRAGYAFQSCGTAREAIAIAETMHPHAVVAAYRLPDANGFTLAEKLKRTAPDVAVILLSEVDFPVAADDPIRANVRTLLKKPFDLTELEAALHSACSMRTTTLDAIDWKREVNHPGISSPLFK